MDISKNQWRSTGGKVDYNLFTYVFADDLRPCNSIQCSSKQSLMISKADLGVLKKIRIDSIHQLIRQI